MPKLVAIGDSLTQGVKNGAVYDTDLSYPALIAEAMGLKDEFRVPEFPGSGLPLNIEALLQTAHGELGEDIEGFEWARFLPEIREFAKQVDKLYRCGEGSKPAAHDTYHNLAVAGFRVFDSFKVCSKYCSEQIEKAEKGIMDDIGIPTASMYRIAQRVLNPAQKSERECWTQIDNLRHLNAEGCVKNLILFLGANDCLKTVVNLEIEDMGTADPSDNPEERRHQYNLTSKDVFEDDYSMMVRQISDAICADTKVFVGTVPHVTIPPITQGIWGKESGPYNTKYAPFYGPFFANDDNAGWIDKRLKRDQVKVVDDRIDEFNSIIRRVIKTVPKRGKWCIVDICGLLDKLAVKRNMEGDTPEEPLRRFLKKRCKNHHLLKLEPVPSVLRFETDGERRTKGGLFSLDCIHPTTIGYGLIAEEFLRVMKSEKACGTDCAEINWQRIICKDELISNPPKLWDDIIRKADGGATFWNFLFFRVLEPIIKFLSK